MFDSGTPETPLLPDDSKCLENFHAYLSVKRPDLVTNQILRALNIAQFAHNGQKRNNGSDYFCHHILPVATNLLEICQQVDETMLTAAILHDVVEDCSNFTALNSNLNRKNSNQTSIEQIFGLEVAEIVAALTKPPKVEDPRLLFANDEFRRLKKTANRINDPIAKQSFWKREMKERRELNYHYQLMSLKEPLRRQVFCIKAIDRIENLKSDLTNEVNPFNLAKTADYIKETREWYGRIFDELDDIYSEQLENVIFDLQLRIERSTNSPKPLQ